MVQTCDPKHCTTICSTIKSKFWWKKCQRKCPSKTKIQLNIHHSELSNSPFSLYSVKLLKVLLSEYICVWESWHIQSLTASFYFKIKIGQSKPVIETHHELNSLMQKRSLKCYHQSSSPVGVCIQCWRLFLELSCVTLRHNVLQVHAHTQIRTTATYFQFRFIYCAFFKLNWLTV